MSDNMATGIVTIALGVLGVATLAVIFSKNADTAKVINAGGSALAQNIEAATGPITGNNPSTTNSSAFG